MLKSRSPLFRVWFTIFLGVVGPTVLTIVGRPVEEVFTLHALLEVIRASVGGAISALLALHIEKPRAAGMRERADDPSVPGGPITDRRRLPEDKP